MDLHSRIGRVLRRVLERLEAAEVDGRLRLGRVPTDAIGDDVNRQRVPVGRGAQRLDQPAVDEERRIDPVRQLPELLNGLLDLAGELVQHLHAGFLVVDDDVLGQSGG